MDAPAPEGLTSDDAGPPISYAAPGGDTFGAQPGHPARQPPLNTYAVLAPVFGVLVPPAGVAFGHLALPQIKRTGQRGWLAAMCGLVISYLLCAVLVGVLIWLLAGGDRAADVAGGRTSPGPAAAPPPNDVTSIAPAPVRPHTKLDFSQATVGTCVEIEKRDEIGADTDSVSDDEALDLYRVPCQHRVGVYTVVARVSTGAECNSTYVASPPDRSIAVCLNRY